MAMQDIEKLYRSIFKENERVIVITDESEIDIGKLTTNDNEGTITLSSYLRKPRKYWYDQVIFMAKDGLPVKKLLGKEKTQVERDAIARHFRLYMEDKGEKVECYLCKKQFILTASALYYDSSAFKHYLCPDCQQYASSHNLSSIVPAARKKSLFGFSGGDPWEVTGLTGAVLLNPGNITDDYEYKYGETLLCCGKNETIGMCFDIGVMNEF